MLSTPMHSPTFLNCIVKCSLLKYLERFLIIEVSGFLDRRWLGPRGNKRPWRRGRPWGPRVLTRARRRPMSWRRASSTCLQLPPAAGWRKEWGAVGLSVHILLSFVLCQTRPLAIFFWSLLVLSNSPKGDQWVLHPLRSLGVSMCLRSWQNSLMLGTWRKANIAQSKKHSAIRYFGKRFWFIPKPV